jgi:hypothetical protein
VLRRKEVVKVVLVYYRIAIYYFLKPLLCAKKEPK